MDPAHERVLSMWIDHPIRLRPIRAAPAWAAIDCLVDTTAHRRLCACRCTRRRRGSRLRCAWACACRMCHTRLHTHLEPDRDWLHSADLTRASPLAVVAGRLVGRQAWTRQPSLARGPVFGPRFRSRLRDRRHREQVRPARESEATVPPTPQGHSEGALVGLSGEISYVCRRYVGV